MQLESFELANTISNNLATLMLLLTLSFYINHSLTKWSNRNYVSNFLRGKSLSFYFRDLFFAITPTYHLTELRLLFIFPLFTFYCFNLFVFLSSLLRRIPLNTSAFKSYHLYINNHLKSINDNTPSQLRHILLKKSFPHEFTKLATNSRLRIERTRRQSAEKKPTDDGSARTLASRRLK